MLTGCAPKPKQAKTQINITPSMAIANINMDGGAIVYGQRTDGVGSWGKVFRPGQNVIVDMAYGTWNFSVFAYDGANGELTGAIECAALNGINIGEEKEVIDMKINLAQCAGAGSRRVDLYLCSDAEFSSADPVANCSQSGTGIRSWRMRVLGHRAGVPNGEILEGACIVEGSYTGVNVNRRFPSGLGNISRMPAEFVAYATTDCSGSEIVIPFNQNLATTNSDSLKTFQNISVLNLTANLSGNDLDITAPVITITSNSSVLGNGRNWINSANASSFAVIGNCETGLNVNFTVNGVAMGAPVPCPSGTYTGNLNLSILTDTGVISDITLVASQTDGSGNTGSTTLVLNKDTVAPSVIGSVNATTPSKNGANLINSGSITATITLGQDLASQPSGMASNTVSLYSGPGCTGGPINSSMLTDPTTITGTFTLTDGDTYSLGVISTDHAGNNSAVGSCFGPFTADLTPPSVTLNALAGSPFVNGDTEALSLTMSDTNAIASSVLEFSSDGGSTYPVVVTTNPTNGYIWTAPSTSTTAGYLRLTAYDGAGNSNSVQIGPFEIDANPPVLVPISNFSISENTVNPNLVDAMDSIGGGDVDGDGDTLSYTCVYDTTVDGAVSGTNCTSLPGGASFNTATGVLGWNPDHSISTNSVDTQFEIKITATEGDFASRTSEQIFVLTVNNDNRNPALNQPNHQLIVEGDPLVIDFNDQNTALDTDIDGDTITYSCYFDNDIDQVVNNITTCDTLTNLTFNPSTGALNWSAVPLDAQSSYEFKIVLDDGFGGTDSKLFIVNTLDSVTGPPVSVRPNLRVWLQSDPKFIYADTAGTVPITSGSIGAWRNAVPIGNNPPLLATNPVPSRQPNFTANPNFTTGNTIVFDGVDDKLVLPDDNFYTSVTNVTVVVYASKTANIAGGRLYRKGGVADRSYGLYVGVTESLVADAEDALLTATLVNSGFQWNVVPTSLCLIFTIDGAGHHLHERTNPRGSTASAGYHPTSSPLEIGGYGAGDSWPGAISEMQIYDIDLNNTQRNQICNNLSTKYD